MWTHRLAVLTAGATALLIVAGGLVTNTGAALAVPDWPTTFGHNPFLFPWSGMVGGVFYEHSHRLLGAGVGLLTLALAGLLWTTEPRGAVRTLGGLAVVLVCLQGLLGGLRVLLLRDALAVVHGSLAPAFFALTVVLSRLTSPRWVTGTQRSGAPAPPALARLGLGATVALYGQIVLGALTTHASWAGWVMLHVAGAVTAAGLVGAAAGRVVATPAAGREAARIGRVAGTLLIVQLALGLGAYVARFTGLALPGGAALGLVLPVVHRLTGALLLGGAVALTLELWRVRLDRLAARPALRVVSREVAA